MPLVSVVVPVHNGEPYLRQCLESLVAQTLRDIEILVVDDGSTDGTARIIREYEKLDPRLIGLSGPATGSAGAARNVGLDRASGDFLAFIDGDDFVSPTMLELMYRKGLEQGADVVLTKFRTLDERSGTLQDADWALAVGRFPQGDSFAPAEVGDYLFMCTNPAAWSKLFSARFVRRVGLRFQELRRTNDAYFSFTALACAERITYVNDYLLTYRIGNVGSLQGTLHQDPLEFTQALRAIRRTLVDRERFEIHERAFVNLAATFCGGNLNKCSSVEAFQEIYDALRADIFDELGVSGRESAYFLTPGIARVVAQIEELSPMEWLFRRRAEANSRVDALLGRPADPVVGPPLLSGVESDAGNVVIPDVSVIVPVYNSEKYLHECLAGIRAQTRVSLEIVLVNDGSTDSSSAILKEYRSIDPRVVVVTQQNAGLSGARNAGLDVATGRYVCFLDSDDYWQIDALAELVEISDNADLDMLLFDAEAFRDRGVRDAHWEKYRDYYRRTRTYQGTGPGVDLLVDLLVARDYRPSACLYLVNASYLRRRGTRFYPRIAHEDNAFTFDLLVEAARAAHVSVPLYARRVRPGSIMTAGAKAASAHGYLISASEMLKSVSGREFSPKVASRLGDLIAGTLRGANQALPDRTGRTHEMTKTERRADVQALLEVLPRGRRQ